MVQKTAPPCFRVRARVRSTWYCLFDLCFMTQPSAMAYAPGSRVNTKSDIYRLNSADLRHELEGRDIPFPPDASVGELRSLLSDNFSNVHSVYVFHYDLENSKSDGKEYIKLGGESTFVFEPESFHIEMTNLFNGDKNLGDNMNRFMNENWRDVLKELGPVVGDAFRKTLDILIDQFLGLIPYDDVFPTAE